MITTLAATQRSIFEVVTTVFSRGDTLAHPRVLLENLQTLSLVWAVIFIAAGLVCMLHGYRFYRPVTVIIALLIGLFAGYYMGQKIGAAYIVAACLALLFAVTCYPLMKYAVAVLGGLAGAFIGANVWSGIAQWNHSDAARIYWVGALLGLVVCGMLAFVLFKLSVVMFTSVSGALVTVLGVMALLMQVPPWQANVTESLTGSTLVLPLVVFIPALIGLIMQQTYGKSMGEPGGGAKPKPA